MSEWLAPSRFKRVLFFLVMDAVLMAFAFTGAFYLRFELSLPPAQEHARVVPEPGQTVQSLLAASESARGGAQGAIHTARSSGASSPGSRIGSGDHTRRSAVTVSHPSQERPWRPRTRPPKRRWNQSPASNTNGSPPCPSRR